MTPTYVLTLDAEADLRGIIRYTSGQWGDKQVLAYVAKLVIGFKQIAVGKGAIKDLSEIHPRLRVAHCEHHYIFCLPQTDAPALIVAIFHERMDLMSRLADRLGSGMTEAD